MTFEKTLDRDGKKENSGMKKGKKSEDTALTRRGTAGVAGLSLRTMLHRDCGKRKLKSCRNLAVESIHMAPAWSASIVLFQKDVMFVC